MTSHADLFAHLQALCAAPPPRTHHGAPLAWQVERDRHLDSYQPTPIGGRTDWTADMTGPAEVTRAGERGEVA